MARHPRIVAPGQPIHIMQRGNNRMTVFHDAADYSACMAFLRNASMRARCAIHAYVLMGNHLHLLATPEDRRGPARLMQSLGVNYVRYFNHRYQRTGTLWEGRYRSAPVHSQRYFFTCSRYIELNPVRAGMVDHPTEYRWSSFHHNGIGALDALITPHALYHALGNRRPSRLSAYRALFATSLDAEECDAIRYATHRGRMIGDRATKALPPSMLQKRAARRSHGGDRRSDSFRLERL